MARPKRDRDAEICKTFSQRFKLLVEEKSKIGKTQKEIRQELQMTESVFFDYLANYKTPSVESLVKIADYFGVSIDYMLGFSETKSRNESIQTVGKTIGLTDGAIKDLHKIHKSKNDLYKKNITSYLSNLIESIYFNAINDEMFKAISIKNSEGDTYSEPIPNTGYKSFYTYPKSIAIDIFIHNMTLLFESYLKQFLKGEKKDGKR